MRILKNIGRLILKCLKILGTFVGGCIVLILTYFLLFIPIGNELILKGYTEELENYDLGINYEIIASDDQCGKLSGNGNGMQYLSAELIDTEEDPKLENEDWYMTDLWTLDEALEEDGLLSVYYYGPYCPNIKNAADQLTSHDGYYIMYSFHDAEWGSIWNDDLRAH